MIALLRIQSFDFYFLRIIANPTMEKKSTANGTGSSSEAPLVRAPM